MRITLTLQEFGRARRGSAIGTGPINHYKVGGMPPGQEASIANRGSRYQESWQVFRVTDGLDSGWSGHYKSADDALADIQAELQRPKQRNQKALGGNAAKAVSGKQAVPARRRL